MSDKSFTLTWMSDRSKFLEVISCKNKYEERLGFISNSTWYLEIKLDVIPRQYEIKVERSKDEPDSGVPELLKKVNYCNYLWNFYLRRDEDNLTMDVNIKLVFGSNILSNELSFFKGLRSNLIGCCDTTLLADQRMDLILTFSESYKVDLSPAMKNGSSSTELTFPKKFSNLGQISQDFGNLYKSKRDTDVTLICKGQSFEAHKIVLSARSPVFDELFNSSSMEEAMIWKNGFECVQSNRRVYTISDIDVDAFPYFLEFLYSGEVVIPSHDITLSLETAATRYKVNL